MAKRYLEIRMVEPLNVEFENWDLEYGVYYHAGREYLINKMNGTYSFQLDQLEACETVLDQIMNETFDLQTTHDNILLAGMWDQFRNNDHLILPDQANDRKFVYEICLDYITALQRAIAEHRKFYKVLKHRIKR